MNQALVVHITDIHIKNGVVEINKRARAVGSALAQNADVGSQIVVALGGDIAFSAKPEEYAMATQFISELKKACVIAGFESPIIVAAPGNHDCDYSLQDEHERLALWAAAVQDISKAPALFKSLSTVQISYQRWVEQISPQGKEVAPTLIRTSFGNSSSGYCIDSLNTAWSSIKGKREGHLAFCEIDSPRLGDGQIALLVAHHPPNWFHQEHRLAMQRWIDETYDIVLYGHEHYNEEIDRHSRHSGAAVSIVAGSAFHSKDNSTEDGFSMIAFSGGSPLSTTQITFRWTGEKFVVRGEISKREFVANPAKIRPRRSFKKSFLSELDDPGIQLNHPAVTRPIRLSELLIEPRLLVAIPSQAADIDIAASQSATALLRAPGKKPVAFVFGPEQSGKSTLCKYLCSTAQGDGLVPLWLSVAKLSSSNSGEVTAWIKNAINSTYVGEGDVFYQSERVDRIIFLDGLEQLKAGASKKIALIEKCAALAERIVVTMSASSATEGLVLLGRGERPMPEADIYDIVPLSKSSTQELLRKWFVLGAPDEIVGSVINTELEAHCRLMSTRISAMLGRHGLPPYPISVLLLLQLTEAMRESEAIVADGSFGYVMESLIVAEMRRARISISVGTAMGYLAEFAWFLEVNEELAIDEATYSLFHRSFETTHGLTVLEEQVKKDLTEARFISVEAGSIRFRYPYIFHFFLAKHLASIYALPEASQRVDKLIQYVHTDKATSVLTFLAHFSPESDLVDRLLDKADKIHPDVDPVDIWLGSTMFAKFNTVDARKKLLEFDSPDADREISDEELSAEERREGEVSQREMFPAEDDDAGWTSALKLIHVLGQVLRSRSTRMDVSQKTAVVRACIKVARRTLGYAFIELERSAPELVHKASGAFQKLLQMNREKAARQANTFLGWLVVALCCTYAFRVGRACGSDEFMALNSSLLKESKDKNDKLFLLCARVLGERVLVENELVSMYEDASEFDMLPAAIIRRLGRYRLHMSPPDEVQRRRIARKMHLGNNAALVVRAHIPD